MTWERLGAGALAAALATAACAKCAHLGDAAHELSLLAAGAGIGDIDVHASRWAVSALTAAEIAMAAALFTARFRRGALVAFLAMLACGAALLAVATGFGSRSWFGCACGLPFEVPLIRGVFPVVLLRDAALVALAAMAWGPPSGRTRSARVSPA